MALLTALMVGSARVEADQTDRVKSVLEGGATVELPSRAARLVAESPAADRESTALAVVRAALGLRPTSGPAVVGAIAKVAPATAPAIVRLASQLQPKLKESILQAALRSAPTFERQINAAASGSTITASAFTPTKKPPFIPGTGIQGQIRTNQTRFVTPTEGRVYSRP